MQDVMIIFFICSFLSICFLSKHTQRWCFYFIFTFMNRLIVRSLSKTVETMNLMRWTLSYMKPMFFFSSFPSFSAWGEGAGMLKKLVAAAVEAAAAERECQFSGRNCGAIEIDLNIKLLCVWASISAVIWAPLVDFFFCLQMKSCWGKLIFIWIYFVVVWWILLRSR